MADHPDIPSGIVLRRLIGRMEAQGIPTPVSDPKDFLPLITLDTEITERAAAGEDIISFLSHRIAAADDAASKQNRHMEALLSDAKISFCTSVNTMLGHLNSFLEMPSFHVAHRMHIGWSFEKSEEWKTASAKIGHAITRLIHTTELLNALPYTKEIPLSYAVSDAPWIFSAVSALHGIEEPPLTESICRYRETKRHTSHLRERSTFQSKRELEARAATHTFRTTLSQVLTFSPGGIPMLSGYSAIATVSEITVQYRTQLTEILKAYSS